MWGCESRGRAFALKLCHLNVALSATNKIPECSLFNLTVKEAITFNYRVNSDITNKPAKVTWMGQ